MVKKKLRFYPKKHVYYYGRKKLESVTTWIKKFFNEFDEKKVAKKVHYALKAQGIHKTITEIKKEWKVKRDTGDSVHKQIEMSLKDLHYVAEHPKACLALDFVDSLIKEKLENKALLIGIYPELTIYDEELGLAGTVDLLLTFDNGEEIIVDWKTNKAIKYKGYEKSKHELMKDIEDCNFTHYSLQLNTYKYMLERVGHNISEMLILHLTEDLTLIPVDDMKELVEAMLIYDGKYPKEGEQEQKKNN